MPDDLFEDLPSHNARRTDPETSHKAAEHKPYRTTDRGIVWATHRDAYPLPLADYQMEAIIALGGHRNGKFRKRRSDLKCEGLLVDSGLKAFCKESNEQQIRWVINPELVRDGTPPELCPKRPKQPKPSPYDNLDD